MKYFFIVPILLSALFTQAQTADEIVNKSIVARGGLDKIKAIQTVRLTNEKEEERQSKVHRTQVLEQLNADFQARIGSAIQQTDHLDSVSLSGFANSPLRALGNGYLAKTSLPADDGSAAVGLDLTGGLAYEVRVTTQPVLT